MMIHSVGPLKRRVLTAEKPCETGSIIALAEGYYSEAL